MHSPPTSFLTVLALTAALPAQQCRFRDEVFAQHTRQNAIQYGAAVNQSTGQLQNLLLDLYEPAGDTMAARPAFVVVHGGGFVGGGRGTAPLVQLSAQLARAGYVAISIDYRLTTPGSPITPQVITDAAHDFQAAVRWLRANAAARRVDPDRIAAVGSSAGAYTVLASAYADLGEGTSGNPGFSSRIGVVGDLWGALQDPTVIEGDEPPLYIAHGTNDTTVPYVQATRLVAQAQTVGLTYELHTMTGAGHAPWSLWFQTHYVDLLAFAWQHLDLGEVAGLAARPGATSPGTAVLDAHGVAGDFVLLALGTGTGSVPVPGLGTFGLDPNGVVVTAWSGALPGTPRIASATANFAVPPGLQGITLHWQSLELGTWTGLTNVVATPL